LAAAETAVIHLRAVNVAGHSDDSSRDKWLFEQLKKTSAVDDKS